MKRNRRSNRHDVKTNSLQDVFASVSNNIERDRKAADEVAHEQARRGHQTFGTVCETFEGLNEYLDSLVTGLLTWAGVLDEETMLRREGMKDNEAWLRQSSAHKAGVAVMKDMLNRVPKRDEDGNVIRFSEGHPKEGKVVMTRVGSRSLPDFNNGSDASPHGDKQFTTTECAAIHGAFWSKWEQHPVVAEIVKQHEGFKQQRAERRVAAANANKNAKQFTVNEEASPREVAKALQGQSEYRVVNNALAEQLEGRKILGAKEAKNRMPRKSDETSAE